MIEQSSNRIQIRAQTPFFPAFIFSLVTSLKILSTVLITLARCAPFLGDLMDNYILSLELYGRELLAIQTVHTLIKSTYKRVII